MNTIKKVMLFIMMIMSIQVQALDTIQFLCAGGCLAGSFIAGANCFNAFEIMIDGTSTIVIPGEYYGKTEMTAKDFLSKIKEKEKKGKNATWDRIRYANLRFGPSVGWGLASSGLLLACAILFRHSFKNGH